MRSPASSSEYVYDDPDVDGATSSCVTRTAMCRYDIAFSPIGIGKLARAQVCVDRSGDGSTFSYEIEAPDGASRLLFAISDGHSGARIFTCFGACAMYAGKIERASPIFDDFKLTVGAGVAATVKFDPPFLRPREPQSFTVFLNRHGSGSDVVLRSKRPVFNPSTRSYMLNFNGRVVVPSSKNFQVVHRDEPNFITMTFGKVSDDAYVLDYSHPWCATEAFGVGVAVIMR